MQCSTHLLLKIKISFGVSKLHQQRAVTRVKYECEVILAFTNLTMDTRNRYLKTVLYHSLLKKFTFGHNIF